MARGERCLYFADDLQGQEILTALRSASVNVSRQTERGALVLMNAREFAQSQVTTPTQILDLFRERTENARSQGFRGLRVAMEMTWTVNLAVPDETLMQIESLLDVWLGNSNTATVACMYRRERFATTVLRQIVRTHSKVIAGDHVFVSFSGLFRELTRSDLQAFMASGKERRVAKGGYYFRQGELSREVFVLTAGLVKGVGTDPQGGSSVHAVFGPFDAFGYTSAFSGVPYIGSALALEDSRALAWDVQTVLDVILAKPEVSLGAVRHMAREMVEQLDYKSYLTVSPVEKRIAKFLHHLVRSIGRRTSAGVLIEMAMSGEDLAEMVNTTPFTVSRIVAGWQRLKILRLQRGRFLILDTTRLASIAGEPELESVRLRPGPGDVADRRGV